MSSPNTHSGPHPPQGASSHPELRAEVMVKSGPHPPQGGSPSQPHPPYGGPPAVPNPAISGSSAAAAQAIEPKTATREEKVSIRLSIPKPEAFSVFIESDKDEGDEVQIQSLEIEIYDQGRSVFATLIEADLPLVLDKHAESHVFPFSDEQLSRVLPHLAVGNTVEIRLEYLAPNESELTIGIIGKGSQHKLGRFIEHLFHSE